MYRLPPSVANVTLAVPLGTATAAAVAAPGAGFRLRLVGVQMGMDIDVTGVCDMQLDDAATIFAQGEHLNAAGQTNVSPPIPEPGIPLAANTALRFLVRGTVAAGNAHAVVFYFIDAV